MRLFERDEWRRLWPRATAVLVMWALVWLVTQLLALGPDPLQLLLVVALLGAVAWLLVDGVVDPAPGWRSARPDQHDWLGHDPRTGLYVQLLEDQLAGRNPRDRVLRAQLVELADGIARARHGPAAALDPELSRLLRSSPLGLAEITDAVTRLERQ